MIIFVRVKLFPTIIYSALPPAIMESLKKASNATMETSQVVEIVYFSQVITVMEILEAALSAQSSHSVEMGL